MNFDPPLRTNTDPTGQQNFNTDFPIGHFDAQEATKQIKNAVNPNRFKEEKFVAVTFIFV
jgi:hypothetical protein